MGHVLLGAASLTTAVLLVATVLALTARWPRRYGQAVWPMLTAAVLFCLAVGACMVTGYLEFQTGLDVSRFYPVLAWTVLYGIAGGFVLVSGLRRPEGVPLARAWRRGRLCMALVVAAGITAGTFAYLDVSARSRLASIRAEAGLDALVAISGPVAAQDNAAPLYREAFAVLRETERDPRAQWELIWKQQEVRPGDLNPMDPALQEYIEKLQAGLGLLRRAAAKPRCWFDRDFLQGLELKNSELEELRYGARLLQLDALTCAGQGKAGQALDDVVAIFRIARHIDEPIVAAQFYAARIEELGAWALEDVLRLTPPGDADIGRLSLPAPPGYPAKMLRALEGDEVAFGLPSFGTLAEGGTPEWNHRFDLWVGNAEVRPLITTSLYRVFYLEDDVAAYRRTHAEMRALAARPVYDADADWLTLDRALKAQQRGVITAILRPNGRLCVQRAAEADAVGQLARLAAVLWHYRGKEGRYPDQLAQLVPAYLPQLPDDPFDGQPLRARRSGDGLILYSVGPNLVDDGGVPLDPRSANGDLIFKLR